MSSPAAYFLGRNLVGWAFDHFEKVQSKEKVTVVVSLKDHKGAVKEQDLDLKDVDQVVRVLNRANEVADARKRHEGMKTS